MPADGGSLGGAGRFLASGDVGRVEEDQAVVVTAAVVPKVVPVRAVAGRRP
ncbi:hypothetical protein ACFC26_43205 [Kitasatospora purpeofusca]|uniref:hypothetical protein n=1 Tax=Kitasatospora purpeofusca TaxID=67352 RepID=UPI0035E148FC